MLSSLQQSILVTLAYFDMFEYPLTLLELQRYLFKMGPEQNGIKYSLAEIETAWREDEYLQRQIRFSDGWFYLRGRDDLPAVRAERYRLAVKKFRRARRVVKLLACLPFVRQIYVCSSLSFSNARPESDIDLFVVAQAGGVWWARFFCLTLLKLLRLRPEFCLSFFVDADHLNLADLRLAADDVHLAYWLAGMYLFYTVPDQSLSALPQSNAWLSDYLLQPSILEPHPARVTRAKFGWRTLFEFCLKPLAGLAERVQMAIMPLAIKSRLGENTDVMIKPGVIKLHTNDRRQKYWEEFNKRLLVIKTVSNMD